MTPECLHRFSGVAVCAIVGVLSLATTARAQGDVRTPPAAEALSDAVKASPKLVNGLAKELGSTPEQAAGAAGVIFGIAKSLLKPEDFAAMSKAVPGMDALLAAAPPEVAATSGESAPRLVPTPGFASTSSPLAASSSSAASPTPAMNVSPLAGMASAVSALSKMGIKPEMIAKAVPYLSGYLKKNGTAALGSLLGGLFKTGK